MRWIFRYNEQAAKYIGAILHKKMPKPEPWLHIAIKTVSKRNPWAGYAIYIWDTRQVIDEYRSNKGLFQTSDFVISKCGMQRAIDNRQPLVGGRKDINEFFEFGEFDASHSSVFDGKDRVVDTPLYKRRAKKAGLESNNAEVAKMAKICTDDEFAEWYGEYAVENDMCTATSDNTNLAMDVHSTNSGDMQTPLSTAFKVDYVNDKGDGIAVLQRNRRWECYDADGELIDADDSLSKLVARQHLARLAATESAKVRRDAKYWLVVDDGDDITCQSTSLPHIQNLWDALKHSQNYEDAAVFDSYDKAKAAVDAGNVLRSATNANDAERAYAAFTKAMDAGKRYKDFAHSIRN